MYSKVDSPYLQCKKTGKWLGSNQFRIQCLEDVQKKIGKDRFTKRYTYYLSYENKTIFLVNYKKYMYLLAITKTKIKIILPGEDSRSEMYTQNGDLKSLRTYYQYSRYL